MDNEQNNELGNDILSAGDKEARYDQHAKRLLSNKRILAWILRETSEEFREYTVAEIKDMIEGEPEVGVVPTLRFGKVENMCNLGHGIFLDGVKEGMQRGTYMNQIYGILTMLEDDFTEEQICKYQHVDPDFFRQVYQLHESDPEMTPEEIYEQLQEDVVAV